MAELKPFIAKVANRQPLSREEVHVFLGMAPPAVLLKTEKKHGRETFDGWA